MEKEIKREVEKEAKKEQEMFDAWMKTQKEFMDSCMSTQRRFWDTMTDSTKKVQEGFMRACSQGGAEGFLPKDSFSVYNTMVETMLNSTKAYADEAIKMQDACNQTIAKQMEMCMKMASNVFEIGAQKKAA